jgi:hypothetical protein
LGISLQEVLRQIAESRTDGARLHEPQPVKGSAIPRRWLRFCTQRNLGVPERRDANWLDQQGSYMATVAPGPVFRLLAARDLGDKEGYRTAQMPPVSTGLLDGELAWRQHHGSVPPWMAGRIGCQIFEISG